MSYPDNTSETIAARGEALYQQNIRNKVESMHKGKFLAIDIKTGDYAIADENLVATDTLLAKHPDATVYGLRIGFPAAYRIGFKAWRRTRGSCFTHRQWTPGRNGIT